MKSNIEVFKTNIVIGEVNDVYRFHHFLKYSDKTKRKHTTLQR